MHVPAAAHIINFVVLTAALSGMNCNLYLCTRMVFSLARGGYAPASLGRVSAKGTPIRALMISTVGLAVATGVAIAFPASAYVYMFGIALFGGLFVWLMIFITHLGFRASRDPRWKIFLPTRKQAESLPARKSANAASVAMPFFPWTTIAGGLAVLAILISTWWVEGMRVTLESGIPWLLALTAIYIVWARKARHRKLGGIEPRQGF